MSSGTDIGRDAVKYLWIGEKGREVTSIFMKAVFFISFLVLCIASCASQKDMVHLNTRVNDIYRLNDENKKIIGELEEVLKAHEDEQWELREAISELKRAIAQQASMQTAFEQELKGSREEQEEKARQLEEARKQRDVAQEARLRELEQSLKVKEVEQEAARQKAFGAITQDQDSLRATIAQLQADLLGVNENIRVLNGRIEENNYLIRSTIEKDTTKIDAIVSQINELSLITEDFRSRLEGLENYVSAETEAKKERARLEESSPPAQKGETESLASQQRELTESERYERALGYYKDDRYEEAMRDFNEFLQLYPKSDLADNAHFWIGESYRAQGKYEEAILAYQKVINNYPKGNKVPAAMLQQGIAFEKIDDKTTAVLVYKRLVKNFPKTKEAEIAQKKIQGAR
jgi:tol-pal system protein YbgF